jgi:hypothetical protein
MNCKVDVGADSGKFFAQAFVCADCFRVAERIFVQGNAEIEQLRTTLREVIRLAIIQGQLSFPEAQAVDENRGEIPQKKALEAVFAMMKKCPPTSKTRSTEITRQPAPTQAAAGPTSSECKPISSTQETASPETPPMESSENAGSAKDTV